MLAAQWRSASLNLHPCATVQCRRCYPHVWQGTVYVSPRFLIANRGGNRLPCGRHRCATSYQNRSGVFRCRCERQAMWPRVMRQVHIGGSAPKDSYLRWERIIEAAQATGAQAIHPRLRLPERERRICQRLRCRRVLVFIGPPASAIQAMGLKAESKPADGEGRCAAGTRLPRCKDQDVGTLAARGRSASATPCSSRPALAVVARACVLWDKAEDFADAAGIVQARGDQQLWR